MKRPKSIEGRIRYYGIALAELAAQAYLAGAHMSYNIRTSGDGTHYISVHLAEFAGQGYEIVVEMLNANDDDLDYFERRLEEVTTARWGQEVLS